MRKVLLLEQGELLVVGRIIGHDPIFAAVVNDWLAVNILDYGGVAVRVLERKMDGRLSAARLRHHELNFLELGQRLGDRRRMVQNILRPQPRLQARLAEVARPEIGRRQIEHMGGEAALVEAVGGADPVDRNDHAPIFRNPGRRVLLDDDFGTEAAAVAFHAAREDRDLGLVETGQSIDRPTITASLLPFHKIRVQASAA